MSAPIERPLRLAREQRASSPSSRESAAVLEASGVRLRASGDVLRDDSRTRERPPLRGGRGRAHVPQLRRTCRASVLVRDSPTFPYCYVGRVRCHARPHARSHCDRREPESAQCRGAACCAPTSARECRRSLGTPHPRPARLERSYARSSRRLRSESTIVDVLRANPSGSATTTIASSGPTANCIAPDGTS